jgi:hypothetical protein
MLQRQLSHLNARKRDRPQVSVSYILYVRPHVVLDYEHVYYFYLFIANLQSTP